MNRTVKKIWDGITTILVALVVVLAVLLVGVRVVGMQVFTVLSGSMEPTYHTGSLIYVKKVDPFQLQSGDVITFLLDEETVATHRIVEVVPDEEDPSVVRFQTKGDANDAIDGGLVHYKNVIGSPVFTIPKLGYVANYIKHTYMGGFMEETTTDIVDETMTGGGNENGMQISSDLIRGHINTIILRCLYDEDKYGYDIINEIERKSGGLYTLKQPTLYSAL